MALWEKGEETAAFVYLGEKDKVRSTLSYFPLIYKGHVSDPSLGKSYFNLKAVKVQSMGE